MPKLTLVGSGESTPDQGPPAGGGGGGGTIETMESRVAKLESTLQQLQTDVAVMKANYATREDLHKAINEQTWKLITWTTGLGAVLVGATFWIARYV